MHSSRAGGAESRYGLFYAPAALAVVALALLPLFKDVVVCESSIAVMRYSYGTVFTGSGTAGLVLAIAIAALAIAHAIQLASRRDNDSGAVAAVPPGQSQEADAAKG